MGQDNWGEQNKKCHEFSSLLEVNLMLLDFFHQKIGIRHFSFLPPNFHLVADTVLLFPCLHLCIRFLSLVLSNSSKTVRQNRLSGCVVLSIMNPQPTSTTLRCQSNVNTNQNMKYNASIPQCPLSSSKPAIICSAFAK